MWISLQFSQHAKHGMLPETLEAPRWNRDLAVQYVEVAIAFTSLPFHNMPSSLIQAPRPVCLRLEAAACLMQETWHRLLDPGEAVHSRV